MKGFALVRGYLNIKRHSKNLITANHDVQSHLKTKSDPGLIIKKYVPQQNLNAI